MWKEDAKLQYKHWAPENWYNPDSGLNPFLEEPEDFIISPNGGKKVAADKCSYEQDFVPIQPFDGLKQSMGTVEKMVRMAKIYIIHMPLPNPQWKFSQCHII
jgi:hypothetical protein